MPSFRTQRGYGHIDGETLRLESSLRLQLRQYREGDPVTSVSSLLLFGVAVGYPVYLLATGEFQTLAYWVGGVGLILAAALAVNRWQGYSQDDEIPLVDVTHVRANQGGGTTAPRLVVFYRRDGENRRRSISMPKRSTEAFDRARELFEEHDIPVEDE